MLRYTLFLLFLACSGLVFPQSKAKLFGYVRDDAFVPMQDVNIYVVQTGKGTTTDEKGYYELELSADSSYSIQFSFTGFHKKTIYVNLNPGEKKREDVELRLITLVAVEIHGVRMYEPIEKLKPIDFRMMPTGNSSIEDMIKSAGLGVSSHNEMSASYSVRGGNFDENLIYVNNIEIYRPFLVRSGQQEGLSFINSDMVEDIYFSSGGFEARYGDKMSSVLDIKYKKPIDFKGSFSASLMGGSIHLEGKKKRFSYLTGFRYRSNSYLLNSLPTKGDYKPVFADGQALLSYMLSEKWNISFLGHYSSNLYRFVPETRETDFGTVNEALRLTVYFDGQEITKFETMTGALTLEKKIDDRNYYQFIASAYHSIETEAYDIQGQYRLDELERDLGSENFGDVLFTRGVGTFLNHARNELDAWVYNFSHIGTREFGKHNLHWGARAQGEKINDRLSEWDMLDSAGFSIPQIPTDEILLNNVLKTKVKLSSNRISGHIQDSWTKVKSDTITYKDSTFTSYSVWNFNAGVRGNFWDFNNQFVFSPRAGVSWTPSWFSTRNDTLKRINAILRFKTGVYYQPPFYRELRDLNGNINYDIRAQRSIHFVLGGDLYFTLWKRTFKFTTELYYKQLNYLIPYEVDNVRIRYYATNNSKGYAAGWDFKINGEFIKGVESWMTLGFLRTYEDIKDDYYYNRYNSDGEIIVPGYTYNNVAVDSTRIEPGYIPRPTNQLVTFGLYFQDEMPKWPTFKVHLNVLFGSRLPYGPPDYTRYKDTLHTPFYRRVDIGFTKQFLSDKDKLKPGSIWTKVDDILLSLEVFNLLGINNTISYQWVEDVNGRTYSVPNYLTSRRVNLKLVVRF